MKVTVIVATHLKYKMPKESCYLPLQVGRMGRRSIGFQGDDTGDNISRKNPYYCELTGLYWLWKNVDSDYLGVVHYRRYLGKRKRGRDLFAKILTEQEILAYMRQADILLPKKRRYYIESVYKHYAHTHYAEHLNQTRAVIEEYHPDYLDAFDRVMKRSCAHMFNMFVMSREKCDMYCRWIFDILGHLEEKVDVSRYDEFQARVFGRVSEMMLDVWLEKNQFPYREAPIIYMERKRTAKKALYFARSRLLGKKYDKSV